MQQRYLDNASTSFPKPREVADAVYSYIINNGCNIGRGCYESAYKTEELVFETRQLLCDLFHGSDCRNVIFTKNVTESLNIIIKGFLKPGDHVLVSSMEHNAIMRPLTQLTRMGISFSRIPCDSDGCLQTETIDGLLTNRTKAIIMTHASNVCGTIMPIAKVGCICRQHGLRFIVDSAQTAGILPIHMQTMHIDALAFTGHKGLLGPQGIGGFLLQDDMVPLIDPLLSGGTGSISHTEDTPEFMPDRFEPGTMNLPGIMGLRAGLLWLKEQSIDRIYNHELSLTKAFLKGLLPLEHSGKIHIIGKHDCHDRVGVVSIQPTQADPSQIAYLLDEQYAIMTRVGLHCAPAAHKSLGTFPTGTIRFSFGWNNDISDVDAALRALEEIIHGL